MEITLVLQINMSLDSLFSVHDDMMMRSKHYSVLSLNHLLVHLKKRKSFCSGKGMLTISTDSMDLAGDLVQSLGSYLGIEVSGRRVEEEKLLMAI